MYIYPLILIKSCYYEILNSYLMHNINKLNENGK